LPQKRFILAFERYIQIESALLLLSKSIEVPPFKSHPMLNGGHRQTLGAVALRGDRHIAYQAYQHILELSDGDSVVIHDDCPEEWQIGQPFVLLMHGLAGCHQSGYMVRLADKLSRRNIRVFRLDHRGCGAGTKLAQRPYNAGASDDVRDVLSFLAELCPGSAAGVAGFSLSANILIKMLGEDSSDREGYPFVTCAIAVCPPLDLSVSADSLSVGFNKFYERHFVKMLSAQYYERRKLFPDGPHLQREKLPTRLREFDDCYTAPAAGFGSVDEYYERCSGKRFISEIEVPTLVVNAANDPLIPRSTIESIRLPDDSPVEMVLTAGGGHLGFVARQSDAPDRWWIDWRVIDWFEAHLL
jgi:predicted alpha/beta-fold hydrolase